MASQNYPRVTSSFESIATATGTGSSGTITFSSIPSTYKHLQIRAIVRSQEATGQTNYQFQINGDTAGNYAAHRVLGDGTTVSASGSASATSISIGAALATSTATGMMSATIIDILDYASTSKNKTVRILSGHDSNQTFAGRVDLRSGLWMSTSAVTSLSFFFSGQNFSTSTQFALYGIKG